MEEIQKKTKKSTTATNKSTTEKQEGVKKQAKVQKASVENNKTKVPKKIEEKKQTQEEQDSHKKKTKKKEEEVKNNTSKVTKKSTEKNEVKASTTKKVSKSKVEKVEDKKFSKVTSKSKSNKESKSKKKVEDSNQTEPKLTIIHEKKDIVEEIKEKPKKAQQKSKKEKTKENIIESKEKKYIDISVGSIICIIIILILLIINIKLGIHAYKIIVKNANLEEQFDDTTVTQEVGNVLDSNNEIVTKLLQKITLAPNVTASIYNEKTFNSNTIPNDLKLRLGWAKTKDEHKLESINENNQTVQALEKATMEESIKNIFGPEVKYLDESFNNTNVSTFSTNSKNQGIINYNDGLYTGTVAQTSGEMAPLIYQEVEKAVRYSDKIIIYVKTAFVNTKDNKYVVYRNFEKGQFKGKLLELTQEELFPGNSYNENTGEGAILLNSNTKLDNIRNELNTYKYTFSLNENHQTFYLSEFVQE